MGRASKDYGGGYSYCSAVSRVGHLSTVIPANTRHLPQTINTTLTKFSIASIPKPSIKPTYHLALISVPTTLFNLNLLLYSIRGIPNPPFPLLSVFNLSKMATYNLALVLKNALNDAQFLLLKQTRPPKFGHEEYDSFVDSDLWDLPSTKLNFLDGDLEPRMVIEGMESFSEKMNLGKFDIASAINRVFFLFNLFVFCCR